MESNNILSSGIADKSFLSVFDSMAEKRFSEIDLTPLLMYFIDVVPSAALTPLAEQFDVAGYKGIALCDTDEDIRNLLKRAIALHRFKGTVWAIREALRAVGYADCKIQEHCDGIFYDGVEIHDGSRTYGAGNWATFRLQILDIGETKGISSDQIALITQIVNEYKNARSTLLGMLFAATTSDTFEEFDELEGLIDIIEEPDYMNESVLYDGAVLYGGSEDYNPDISVLHLKLINSSGVVISEEDI